MVEFSPCIFTHKSLYCLIKVPDIVYQKSIPSLYSATLYYYIPSTPKNLPLPTSYVLDQSAMCLW